MKKIIWKLIQAFLIFLVIILFLFLFVDCKMESEKLRLKYSLLKDENEKLSIEAEEMRKHYALAIFRLIEKENITFDDLIHTLPEKELAFIRNFQSPLKQ